MKAGKALEQFVKAIQEYLKNSPDTLIVSNAKLKDHTGIEREIDVFVQIKAQGGKVGIAFECKDYKKKVGVEIVEAFYSKFSEISEIHKGIIVSSHGFTDCAQRKANFYGIDLYQIEEVPYKDIFNSVDLFYTQGWFEMDTQYQAFLEENTSALYYDNKIYFCSDNKEVEMINYLRILLRSYMPSLIPGIHNYLHSLNVKSGIIPLILTPPDKLFMFDNHRSKHIVKELQVNLRVTLNMELQKIEKQSLYINTSNETPIVRVSEYTRKDGINLLLVHGSNNSYRAFMKDIDGNYKAAGLLHLKSKS